jgi:hypothetical protein
MKLFYLIQFEGRRKICFVKFLVLPVLLLQIHSSLHSQTSPGILFPEEDCQICSEKLNVFSSLSDLSPGELVIRIGESFLGAPYVAKSLEAQPEQLVVNLRGFDCTTFLESCLSLTRCVKNKDTSCSGLSKELMDLRYRKGAVDGYVSRLHYFSEWISCNSAKGLVRDVTAELGGETFDLELDFMSTHPALYAQLSHDSSLVSDIRIIEKKVSSLPFSYIPKEKLMQAEQGINNGDILAITSTIRGLDIAHTGFAVRKDGRIYMLHASSLHKKVEITAQPLQEYLQGIGNMSGVMVIRPLD